MFWFGMIIGILIHAIVGTICMCWIASNDQENDWFNEMPYEKHYDSK